MCSHLLGRSCKGLHPSSAVLWITQQFSVAQPWHLPLRNWQSQPQSAMRFAYVSIRTLSCCGTLSRCRSGVRWDLHGCAVPGGAGVGRQLAGAAGVQASGVALGQGYWSISQCAIPKCTCAFCICTPAVLHCSQELALSCSKHFLKNQGPAGFPQARRCAPRSRGRCSTRPR